MSTGVFQLRTLSLWLEEDLCLTESIGFWEISALGTTGRESLGILQAKARELLENPELSPTIRLHRRRGCHDILVQQLELDLAPPSHLPAWREPATLRVPYIRWLEQDMHFAYLPAMRILVCASQGSQLPDRLRKHLMMLLYSRRQPLSLAYLARMTRHVALEVGSMDVKASLKSPRELAEVDDPTKAPVSQLDNLAEELPSLLTRLTVPKQSTPWRAYEFETELASLAERLAGPTGRSVLVVGPPGCGKTALIHEFALRRGEFGFAQSPFWSTSAARLMKGDVGFGMWQDRCRDLCQEAAGTKSVLHLGNLAELIEVGKARRGEQSVASFIRPWIVRGEFLALAECTPEQLALIERIEPHLPGAFSIFHLPARTSDQTRAILEGVLADAPGRPPTREEATDNGVALDRLHRLHQRYATYSAQPGPAVRFLRRALMERFPGKHLLEADVLDLFSRQTGLPAVLLDDRVPLDLERTRQWLSERVMGQSGAVDRVLDLLALIKARLARPCKPLASLLFIGPTGTGKTELAKAIAAFLFGDSNRLARFDLNQFNDPISIQRLIGGPVAGTPEGLLTARVREEPFSVLLLDEFEKADPAFFDLLLQVLGDARLTDAAGRVADFSNCVIVMTSNLGAENFQRGAFGFRADGPRAAESQEHFSQAVRQFLSPEAYNRIDAVVPFAPLSQDTVRSLARREVGRVLQRDGLQLRPIEVQIDDNVVEYLVRRGHDPKYGARPLKRAVENELMIPLAEALQKYTVETPLRVRIDAAQDRVTFKLRRASEEQSSPDNRSHEMRSALTRAIVQTRRSFQRLLGCHLFGTLDGRITLLASLERRTDRRDKKSALKPSELALLQKLRRCADAILDLSKRIQELEDEALGAFYGKSDVEFSDIETALENASTALAEQKRELFRLTTGDGEKVVVCLYSEHLETLLEMARSYAELGSCDRLDYLLPPASKRSRNKPWVREQAPRPAEFFVQPPPKMFGVLMQLRGDLLHARLDAEAGLHVVRHHHAKHQVWIQTDELPLPKVEPPQGIELKNGIASLAKQARRTYDYPKKTVQDRDLGKRPWSHGKISILVSELTAQRLDQRIEEETS